MLHRLFAVNRRLCERIEPYLPQTRPNIFELYKMAVAQLMNSGPHHVVVDAGGGNSCPFAGHRIQAMKTKIVTVDISEEEMKENRDVDEKRVADIMRCLPFEDESVDLVVSRSVLEHLTNIDGFVSASRRVLKEGGHFVHLLPCRYAPFAVINRLLPNRLSKVILYFLRPESRGEGGYPAFYDNCYYSAIVPLLEKRGFEVVDVHVSYYQSSYFSFFAPLFLVSALYEVLVRALGVRNLCAFILVVARKK